MIIYLIVKYLSDKNKNKRNEKYGYLFNCWLSEVIRFHPQRKSLAKPQIKALYS